ncbi:MAG: hypothetical protein ACFFCL_15010 [Promethearchaeota archaeon]
MKRKRYFYLISISFIIFIGLSPRVFAVLLPAFHPENIFIMFLVFGGIFILSVSIEILIIIIFIRKSFLFQKSKLFFKSVVSVNLLTFVIIQLLVLVILAIPAINFFEFFLYCTLIEIIPIILECILFMEIYRNLNKMSYFRYPIKNKTIILSTIIANLITVFIGAGLLYIFPQIIY